MKIVKFLGGLGNQMFQYAFYKTLENKAINIYADLSAFKNYSLHNGYELERVFGILVKKAPNFYIQLLKPNQNQWFFRKLKRILGLKTSYREEVEEFVFNPSFINQNTSNYYWGYWQAEEYFRPIAPEIRNAFRFKHQLDPQNLTLLHQISNCNSISIHIRRGDYLKETGLGNVCDKTYYNNAIQYILSKVENPIFYIFSDEIDWCQQNLSFKEVNFINWNSKENSYKDMQLMSCCKHNIIANSTFSWWSAWLNSNPEKIVICPSKWTNHSSNTLALKEWIKL